MPEVSFLYWDGLPILIQNDMEIDQDISGKIIEDFDPVPVLDITPPSSTYEGIRYDEATYEGFEGLVIRQHRYFLMFRGALSERFRKHMAIKASLSKWEPPKLKPQPFQESVHSEQSISLDFILFRR